MIICNGWTEYVKLILNHAGHGYEYLCPISIPAKKENKVNIIDRKIVTKYPMVEWGKDRRYKAKKTGWANYAYLRWSLSGILLHTHGLEAHIDDPDAFSHLSEVPYVVKIGTLVDIKIGNARSGKKYTAFLTKESFRDIKARLRDDLEHRRLDAFEKTYYNLETLPAFSGILAQIEDIYRFLRKEIKRAKGKNIQVRRLVLRKVY